jgi:transcriptional regulator with XRE-family HTH domain
MLSTVPRPAGNADPALAAVLRRLREARGISQEALAYQAGITSGSLARIELCQSSPAWVTVRQVAEALGITMVELARLVERER